MTDSKHGSVRSPRNTLLALGIGMTAGILLWNATRCQPDSLTPAVPERSSQIRDRETRKQVTWTADARELVESIEPQAGSSPGNGKALYRLAGTVMPPPDGECTIEFVLPDDTNEALIFPVGPTGQFSASLPETRIPPGRPVFARVRSGPKLTFAGLVPAVPGLRLQTVSPVPVRGTVRVRFPERRDGQTKALSIADVRIGIQGWLGDRFVTVQPDDAGRFEAEVLPPPSETVPIVVLLEPGSHMIHRAEFSTKELAGGVAVAVTAGLLRLRVSDQQGDPVTGAQITAGWSPAESRRGDEESFFPVELQGSGSKVPYFLVAPGVIAGTITAPNLAQTAFRREVSPGEDAIHTVTMAPAETEQLRVRLVNEAGKPVNGWVFAQASEDTHRPGAFVASGTTQGDECIALLEVPADQPVDVFGGGADRARSGGLRYRRRE